MNIVSINSAGYSPAFVGMNPTKLANRKFLKPAQSNLKPLFGPEEVKKAKRWVAAYTAENALLGAATAQTGPLGVAALSIVEMEMATHIFNGIYGFNFNETAFKSIIAGCSGAYAGTKVFDMAAKSVLAFIPGIGNGLNAAVSGTITAALGASLIAMAEKMDKARKNQENLDKFFKEMEK